ncbi:Sua5 YciO YrdC YwlC family protein [Arcobacter sp. F155]|uniref:Sua5 YciO YrdC YwlC family protein n=1 Tax=Arcobacter sp. F155 TaxID=2044512 RepID=UPI00100A7222|nr:Sua5 YciO YrdC YwlC family protein [Arcobacter sp. F155]RXJ77881.1 Sua5 YciO YrdC YwlC family protein [Arcobacter sp. F155]
MDTNLIYLVQTDTTVGFSSGNDEKLATVKRRPKSQKILQTLDSFTTLKKFTRVPKNHRKRVRNSKKSTFIYPNMNSYRVVDRNDKFYSFIKKFKAHYSTSANHTKKSFEKDFALANSDVIVSSKEGFSEKVSSSIYLLKKSKIKKIR